MRLGYNTNGLAHHDPLEAISLLAELGYRSVALTIDQMCLNPRGKDCWQQAEQIGALLEQYDMTSVIETGTRFLLDPRVKHEPTLLTAEAAGRRKRIEFLKFAVDVAARLQSDCVSFWSGILREDIDAEAAWNRLIAGLEPVIDYAAEKNVAIGFEPEPGMFIDTMDRFAELLNRLKPRDIRLTLDVGHLQCQGELPIEEQIARWADRIVNVHIEDMKQGIHEHLMFGEGEIDFPPILTALNKARYAGGLQVELSRHSHVGPTAARAAIDFLQPMI